MQLIEQFEIVSTCMKKTAVGLESLLLYYVSLRCLAQYAQTQKGATKSYYIFHNYCCEKLPS